MLKPAKVTVLSPLPPCFSFLTDPRNTVLARGGPVRYMLPASQLGYLDDRIEMIAQGSRVFACISAMHVKMK